MAAKIIASNVQGPLPLKLSFTAPMDGTVTFQLSGTAWSNVANTLIGVQVELDGTPIGSTQIYSNGAAEHRTLPTALLDTDLSFGQHTLTLLPLNAQTITDSNDFFSIALLM